MSVAIAAVFTAWLVFQFGGATLTVAVDDIGEGFAALACAGVCFVAARRSRDRMRRAWTLIGLSAASWCVGEIIWSVNEVALGITLPFPSVADVFYLGAIPLEIAGILAFGQPSRGTSTGLRLWVDRLIVALSLLFVGWAFGLQDVYNSSGSTPFARLLGLAYPLGDIMVGTVLILSIRRAVRQQQGPFLLLLVGMGAISLSDSAFAYLTAKSAYFDTTVLDAGWLVGFLLIMLAALWPSRPVDASVDDEPIDMWQLALPWLGVLAVAATLLTLALTGEQPDTPLLLIAGVLAGLLFFSQIFAHRESLTLLLQARRIASTLNDVVVHAPLGIVRLNRDLTVIQANPRAAALLRRPESEVTGTSIDEYFAAAESVLIHYQLLTLSKRGGSVEFDIEAGRGDGSRVFIHWSATAVRGTDGTIEYFIAMLEDVSAPREAVLTAISNLGALERLNRIKIDFLTRVRHEFRTALVGIQGFSELIRDGKEMEIEELTSFADDIYRDAQRLDKALGDMMALDSVDSTRTDVQTSSIDLNEMVGSAISAFRARSSSHVVDLALSSSSAVITGDRHRLTQVIDLLLDNAAARLPSGGVIVVRTTFAGSGNAEIVIAGDRLGTSEATRNEARVSPNEVGRGGLSERIAPMLETVPEVSFSAARQIVELHRGRIWFGKTEAGEAECHVELPTSAAVQNGEEIPAVRA